MRSPASSRCSRSTARADTRKRCVRSSGSGVCSPRSSGWTTPELRRLHERILLHDPTLAPAAEAPAAGVRNPYKGLRAFSEEDAEDFFGRERLVEQLLGALAEGRRLVALVGPSGCGKSSVANAGLVSAVRRGRLPGSERWVVVTMMPGRHPFEELGAALRRAEPSTPADLGARLATGDLDVLAAVGAVPDREPVLLVIDQFEELFSAAGEPDRLRFLDELTRAVADAGGRLRLLLTLRADFYDRPLLHPGFASAFTAGIVNVLPMTADEIREAVVGPARRVRVEVDPALLVEIVADTSDQPGALPLLQYALTELFEHRSGPRLTLEDYRAVGGLRGALSRRAEEVFGRLDDAERDVALQAFLRLVALGRGAKDSRRRVPVSELTGLEVDTVALSNVLDGFGRSRLLSFDRDPLSGQAVVEVAHESLLWEWERLAGWIDLYRADLHRHDALVRAVREWEASGRDPDYLFTGSRLDEFERWSRGTQLRLTDREGGFLRAAVERSEAQRAREEARLTHQRRLERRARRRLLALTGAVVLLTAAVTYGVLAWLGTRPPDVALVWEGGGDWGGIIDAGFDRAVSDFDLRAVKVSASENGFDPEIRRLSEDGVDLIVVGSGAGDVNTIAREFPDTRYVWIDYLGGPTDLPNVSYVISAEAEGSFLAGAAAALKSQTGTIGFIGGVDIPLIHEFQAGYEAGARWVDPSIEVRSRYLTEYFDLTGFDSPTLAWHVAERLYRRGTDVVYHAAGDSGLGVFRAAGEMRGRHVWVIGVDVDQYRSFAALGPQDVPPEIDIEAWPSHVLTSMLKRLDVAVHTVLEEWSRGIFTPGVREFGLAEGGVDLAYSGGFIDDLRPVIEDLRAKIIAGEIEVPTVPEGRH